MGYRINNYCVNMHSDQFLLWYKDPTEIIMTIFKSKTSGAKCMCKLHVQTNNFSMNINWLPLDLSIHKIKHHITQNIG